MAKKNHDEEPEFEEYEEEDEDDEDEDAIEPDDCRICEAEVEIGSDLCEDCGKCACCDEPWDYKTAKGARKTGDGRVCESCYEENYSEDDLDDSSPAAADEDEEEEVEEDE